MTTSFYLSELAHLRVYKKGSRIAPNKAVLLLAVCDLVEQGIITRPFIPLDGKLENAFKTQWMMYVPNSEPSPSDLSYPFFHLSSSEFWQLKKTSMHIGQTEYSSLESLKRDYSGANIDEELFDLIKSPDTRKQIIQILISTYLSTENITIKPKAFVLLPLIAIISSIV